MARKKMESIESLGGVTDKLTVQKSLPLFSLWQSDLTLAEFKILDTYLSRINSHEPNKRSVVFEKGEIEKCLGVSKINMPDLKKRLYHLMGNVVEVPDNSIKKGFKAITLFEEAEAEQDDYGVWKVKLECTQKAMKYFFNIDNLGYLRYKLRCITSITSRYTYILFVYLEANRYRKSWEIDLEDLKVLLNCDKEETYKSFKRFNDRLLKRVQKEMHEKTECRFSYDSIKKGRSVVAIRFTLKTLPKLETVDLNQITLEQWQNETENKELWESAIEEFNFSEVQIEEIRTILQSIPTCKLPQDNTTNMNDISFRRYHYIAMQVATLKRCDNENKIKNKFAYFVKMIKADIKEGQK